MRRDQVVIAVLCLGGTLLIGTGIRGTRGTQPRLVIDPAEQSFGVAHVGDVVTASYALTNHSDEPIRIIGSGDYCMLGNCIAADGLPTVIPPHRTSSVALKVEAKTPCDYDGRIELFSTCPGYAAMSVRLTGRILP